MINDLTKIWDILQTFLYDKREIPGVYLKCSTSDLIDVDPNDIPYIYDGSVSGTFYNLKDPQNYRLDAYTITDIPYLQESSFLEEDGSWSVSRVRSGNKQFKLIRLATDSVFEEENVYEEYVAIDTFRGIGLIKSYFIPETNPAFPYLEDRCFTYDQSVAIVAACCSNQEYFANIFVNGLLQCVKPNGAIPFSVNRLTGISDDEYVRIGAQAWCAYALAYYLEKFPPTDLTFKEEVENKLFDILDYMLLFQVTEIGYQQYALRGGKGKYNNETWIFDPNYYVPWCSTEHNIDAYFALEKSSHVLNDSFLYTKSQEIKNALLTNFWNSSENRFYQGISSQTEYDYADALDCRSWGSIFLHYINESEKGLEALKGTSNYYITDVNYVEGYRPYIPEGGYIGAEELVWPEGSFGVALAELIYSHNEEDAYKLMNQFSTLLSDKGLQYATVRDEIYQLEDWYSFCATAWYLIAYQPNGFWGAEYPALEFNRLLKNEVVNFANSEGNKTLESIDNLSSSFQEEYTEKYNNKISNINLRSSSKINTIRKKYYNDYNKSLSESSLALIPFLTETDLLEQSTLSYANTFYSNLKDTLIDQYITKVDLFKIVKVNTETANLLNPVSDYGFQIDEIDTLTNDIKLQFEDKFSKKIDLISSKYNLDLFTKISQDKSYIKSLSTFLNTSNKKSNSVEKVYKSNFYKRNSKESSTSRYIQTILPTDTGEEKTNPSILSETPDAKIITPKLKSDTNIVKSFNIPSEVSNKIKSLKPNLPTIPNEEEILETSSKKFSDLVKEGSETAVALSDKVKNSPSLISDGLDTKLNSLSDIASSNLNNLISKLSSEGSAPALVADNQKKSVKEEKPTGEKAKYGSIQVKENNAGFVEIMDETPGNVRKVELHPSGSYQSKLDNGDVHVKTVGKKVDITEKNWEITVMEDIIVIVHKDTKIEIRNDKYENIKGNSHSNIEGTLKSKVVGDVTNNFDSNHSEKIGNNETVTIGGNESKTVNGDVTEKVSGNQTQTVSGNLTINVSGNVNVTANSIMATAKSQVVVSAPKIMLGK